MRSTGIAIALFAVCYGAVGQSKNKDLRWILPLNTPLTAKLGILIQRGGPGVPFYNKSDVMQAPIAGYLKEDTLVVPFIRDDYKYFDLAAPCSKFTPMGSYREYLINYKGRDAWIREIDVMRVNRMDLGTYKAAGRFLHAAIMLPNPKANENECASITTIMMHDDRSLYLVDVTRLNNPALHWKNEPFLSLVNPPRLSLPEASNDANGDFVLTWEYAESREKIKLTIAWADNHIIAKSYTNEKIHEAVSSAPDDTTTVAVAVIPEVGQPKDETVYTDEIHKEECTFEGVDAGDCGHISFSCGDFGDASTQGLSPADSKLWSDVMQGGYPGRTFAITYKVIPGQACGAPDATGNYYHDGPVQGLLTFKLIKE